MPQITRVIQAPKQAVYKTLTTQTGWLDWFCNSCNVRAEAGGRLYLWNENGFQAMGSFSELQPDTKVGMKLFAPDPVALAIHLEGENGQTRVTLDYDSDAIAPLIAELDNFQSVLETGLDRRIYDRPMLGVFIAGMVEKENAANHQTPGGYGIILGDTIPGMGARDAGMQAEDILTRLNEVELTNYRALDLALKGKKAGDAVQVTWYRAGEEHTANMLLSGRPIPDLPASLAELSEQTRSIYDRVNAELAELLDGASDEEAGYRPKENEWNTREILAHIIVGERAMQFWMVNAADGSVFKNWATNKESLVKSTVAGYPTLSEVAAEFKRTGDQTVALISHLPDEIVLDKATFHHIATSLGKHGFPIHTRQHFDTIESLLKQARQQ